MGVYNPYEQMPKSCRGCKYCKNKTNGGFSGYEATYDEEYCDLLKIKLFDHLTGTGRIKFYRRERYEDCPLIEVKAPHGDLKDFDKVPSYKIEGVAKWGGMETETEGHIIFETDWREIPTIIAAEE